jgi:hypothetical protein
VALGDDDRAASGDLELEALWASATLVWDLVHGGAGGSSSLMASLATVAKEVEKWINVAATNGVRWGGLIRAGHYPVALSQTVN